MFTKRDYEQYFQAIRTADKGMITHLDNIISQISEPAIIEKLKHIRSQEEYHLTLSAELLEMLD